MAYLCTRYPSDCGGHHIMGGSLMRSAKMCPRQTENREFITEMICNRVQYIALQKEKMTSSGSLPYL